MKFRSALSVSITRDFFRIRECPQNPDAGCRQQLDYMHSVYLLLFFILFAPISTTALNYDLIVAHDGSGDLTTIQAAIDAAPANAAMPFVILIKNGIYNEKIFIDKPFITLTGENRDSTSIIYAELRANWLKDHPDDDWGSAVLNIGNNANNLILANLTIYNNYGALSGNHDHQFAVRGFDATRIIIINCTIKADGGDTLSLWNRISGMYYHAYCTFEGWVDYVCPRGWCYITDCKFFGYNTPSASIWHDGSKNEDQKFIIKNSYFDGVPGFPLGRNHRDAQFYILDCLFSEHMADRPIYQAKDSTSYQWGQRYYYFHDHRTDGDYNWFADNLWTAENPPAPRDITPVWTFQNRWDPEKEIPAIVPFAAIPKPQDGTYKVDLEPLLTWLPADQAICYRIHFGISNPPDLVLEVNEPLYMPGKLKPDTQYYWYIDVVAEEGIERGALWTFKTETVLIPPPASNPSPADWAGDVQVPLRKLFWEMDITIADTAKLYFGINPDSIKLTHAGTTAGWNPGPLTAANTYYWRVDLVNKNGRSTGDLWRFTLPK